MCKMNILFMVDLKSLSFPRLKRFDTLKLSFYSGKLINQIKILIIVLITTENNPLDDMLNDPEVNSKHISILTFKFTNEKKILQNISDIYYKI